MNIKVEALSKKINGAMVLKDISCEFVSGNIYGIVGKNGSGKTMLLREIAGLIRPTKGSISVDGKMLHHDISLNQFLLELVYQLERFLLILLDDLLYHV